MTRQSRSSWDDKTLSTCFRETLECAVGGNDAVILGTPWIRAPSVSDDNSPSSKTLPYIMNIPTGRFRPHLNPRKDKRTPPLRASSEPIDQGQEAKDTTPTATLPLTYAIAASMSKFSNDRNALFAKSDTRGAPAVRLRPYSVSLAPSFLPLSILVRRPESNYITSPSHKKL